MWRNVPQPGAGPPGDPEDRDDDRRPPWLSILFILVSSLSLWALIIWVVWSLIAPEPKPAAHDRSQKRRAALTNVSFDDDRFI